MRIHRSDPAPRRHHTFAACGLAAALTCALGAPTAAQADGTPPPPVRIFGIDAASIDNAVLTEGLTPEGKNKLIISNLGSSGCDGFSIDLGEGTDGVELELEEAFPLGAPGATMTGKVYGTVDGGVSQLLGTLSVEQAFDPVHGAVALVSADYSPIGATGYTFRAFDAATPYLYPAVLDPDDDDIILPFGPKYIYYVEGIDTDEPVYCCLGFFPVFEIVGISGPGGGPDPIPACDLIELLPVGATGDVVVTRMELMFGDTGDVSIVHLGQMALGASVTGTDDARVEKQGGKLKISNLGSSGCDGFSVDLGGDHGTHIQSGSVAVDPPGSGGGGAGAPPTLTVSGQAIVGGELHEDFATITATDNGPGLPASIDFGCDPKMLGTIWYYEGCVAGSVVVTGDPSFGGPYGIDSFFDVSHCWEYRTTGGGHSDPGSTGIAVQFSQPTTFTVGPTAHTIDELRLLAPALDSAQVSDRPGLTFTCEGIPEMFITATTDEPTPYTNKGDKNKGNYVGHVTLIKEPLSGGGPLVLPTAPALLMLRDSPPLSTAVLFIGLTYDPVPFKGGELAPVPVLLQVGLFTNAEGSIDLPYLWPAGIPAGFELFMQSAVADALAPQGVWLSNTLQITAP